MPSGSSSKPARFSSTLIAVVQIALRGCLSNQDTGNGFMSGSINAEITLVSRMIIR
jgi:hypothetical protein